MAIRTGRPPIALHLREHHITACALALMSFDAFCEQQRLRIMGKGLTYLHPQWDTDAKVYAAAEQSLTPEELEIAYREERLGPFFSRVDRKDDRIQVEWRRA